MKNIVLTRIDDRLIHGQVMTSWLNYTSATKIMVVDDKSAEDPFLKTVLKNAVPKNVGLGVFTAKKAAERLLGKGFPENDRVIILVKYPATIVKMIESGVKFDKVNIGGMGAAEGREKFYKNISASQEEKRMLKQIIDSGSKLEIQIIAENEAVDVEKLL
ncbi:MAG: PTS sugar transporter subunit IIB [Anaerostipes sp.]|jgi:mannose/fructose/N-acetylgalactosamine-specific phosphotransferase system component IIB|nr:PTS sugar transporter subunit IIB [Anaerostipes sp.]MDD3745324.1 PTS sugar transporter subunit IIB [Anaerostipes sp.]